MKAGFGHWHHFVFNFTILFLLYTLYVYFYENINIWACTLIISVSMLSRKQPATHRPGCGDHGYGTGSTHISTRGCRRTLKAKSGPMQEWTTLKVPHVSTLHYSWWSRKSYTEQWGFPGIPNWLCFQGGWSSSSESHFLICCLQKQTVAYLLSRHILWQHIMGAFLSNPQELSKYKQITKVLTPIPHYAHDITVIF